MIEFSEGMRVKITKEIFGWGSLLIGQLGTLIELDADRCWYVKMDNHPGFDSQKGCWIIEEDQMKIVDIHQNNKASFLLDKEW